MPERAGERRRASRRGAARSAAARRSTVTSHDTGAQPGRPRTSATVRRRAARCPRCPRPPGRLSGKCSPTSPSRGGAEQRVGDARGTRRRRRNDPARPASPSNRTPPSHSSPPGVARVHVEAQPDRGQHRPPIAGRPRARDRPSVGDLEVARIARDGDDLGSRPTPGARGVVGERSRPAASAFACASREGVECGTPAASAPARAPRALRCPRRRPSWTRFTVSVIGTTGTAPSAPSPTASITAREQVRRRERPGGVVARRRLDTPSGTAASAARTEPGASPRPATTSTGTPRSASSARARSSQPGGHRDHDAPPPTATRPRRRRRSRRAWAGRRSGRTPSAPSAPRRRPAPAAEHDRAVSSTSEHRRPSSASAPAADGLGRGRAKIMRPVVVWITFVTRTVDLASRCARSPPPRRPSCRRRGSRRPGRARAPPSPAGR